MRAMGAVAVRATPRRREANVRRDRDNEDEQQEAGAFGVRGHDLFLPQKNASKPGNVPIDRRAGAQIDAQTWPRGVKSSASA